MLISVHSSPSPLSSFLPITGPPFPAPSPSLLPHHSSSTSSGYSPSTRPPSPTSFSPQITGFSLSFTCSSAFTSEGVMSSRFIPLVRQLPFSHSFSSTCGFIKIFQCDSILIIIVFVRWKEFHSCFSKACLGNTASTILLR